MSEFYQKCPKCREPEAIFKKKVINGSVYLSPNKFYFCQNPKCYFYSPVEEGVHDFNWVDNLKFQWVKVFPKKTLDNLENAVVA